MLTEAAGRRSSDGKPLTGNVAMRETRTYAEWHIPLSRGALSLREAAADLARVGAAPDEIPLMVRLAENPRFGIFHGAVDLKTHDYIHALLGRGLLAKDEAFVIGFTMGSTHRLGAAEERLFALIAERLYPGIYRFSKEDVRIFQDAVRLAWVSQCAALDRVPYAQHLDQTLDELRRALGIDVPLLAAYFALEHRRYPHSPESQRLLD
jgi:hypothetical protein